MRELLQCLLTAMSLIAPAFSSRAHYLKRGYYKSRMQFSLRSVGRITLQRQDPLLSLSLPSYSLSRVLSPGIRSLHSSTALFLFPSATIYSQASAHPRLKPFLNSGARAASGNTIDFSHSSRSVAAVPSNSGRRFSEDKAKTSTHFSSSPRKSRRNSSRSTTTALSAEKAVNVDVSPTEDSTKGKRKFALCIGYVGSKYYGLQMQKELDEVDSIKSSWLKSDWSGDRRKLNPAENAVIDSSTTRPKDSVTSRKVVMTIEKKLMEALRDSGYILGSNSKDPEKVGLSRSSRTDKGVHSSRVVLSMKLEVPLNLTDSNNSTMSREIRDHYSAFISNDINKFLPPDIRVFSATKMNQGFQARTACSWREYEYILPVELLLRDEFSHADGSGDVDKLSDQRSRREIEDDAIKRFNDTLTRFYPGAHSFHNFHRLGRRDLMKIFRTDEEKNTAREKRKAAIIAQEEHDKNIIDSINEGDKGPEESTPQFNEIKIINDGEDVDDQSEEDSEEVYSEESNSGVGADSKRNKVVESNFDSRWKPIYRPMVLKTLCNIFMAEVVEIIETDGRRLVKVVIRGQSFLLHMIRIMIGAAVAVTRKTMPEVSLRLSFLAPCYIAFPMAPAEGLLLVNAGFGRNINGKHVAMSPAFVESADSSLLLNEVEFEVSEKFKRESIYPKIADDWHKSDGLLYKEWTQFIDLRYKEDHAVTEEWKTMTQEYERNQTEMEAIKSEREKSRRAHHLDKISTYIEEMSNSSSSSSAPDSSSVLINSKDKRKSVKNRKYSSGTGKQSEDSNAAHRHFHHRDLLPNQLATNLISHFRLFPSDATQRVTKNLATSVLNREIPSDLDSAELVAIVERDGLQAWIDREPSPYLE